MTSAKTRRIRKKRIEAFLNVNLGSIDLLCQLRDSIVVAGFRSMADWACTVARDTVVGKIKYQNGILLNPPPKE